MTNKTIAISIASLLISFLIFLPIGYAMNVTVVCSNYTITSSDGSSWSGSSCWEEYSGGGGGGVDGGDNQPEGDGGGGSTAGTPDYEGTPTDSDANNVLDCWKDVTEDGDYDLDDGDDYGPRILNGVNDFHHGIDIAANLGTTIFAPANGLVTDTAQSTALEQVMVITFTFKSMN